MQEIEFAMNNSVNRCIGDTPSRLLFGVEQRGTQVEALKEFVADLNQPLDRELENRRANAVNKIEKAQKYNEAYVNQKRKVARQYQIGNLVMIKNFVAEPGKLSPAYKGPYEIKQILANDRYVVGDIECFQRSQRPYTGVWEPRNMKPWREESEVDDNNNSDGQSEL